jgi:hypothetical protein
MLDESRPLPDGWRSLCVDIEVVTGVGVKLPVDPCELSVQVRTSRRVTLALNLVASS